MTSPDTTNGTKPSQGSYVDRAEVEDFTKKASALAERFTALAERAPEVLKKIVEAAGHHTADGKPAPVYNPLITAVSKPFESIKAGLGQQAQNITADNKATLEYVKAQEQNAENAKIEFDKVETDGVRI